jgi:hypothetical protein
LGEFRKKQPGIPKKPEDAGEFDLVVIGGGIAGTAASISAARLGLKVALIQDRPVLGGNNSSEVRVHLGGHIKVDPFPALGDVVKEIGPTRGGNAQPADYYEDEKKMEMVLAEDNISLFTSFRAFDVKMNGSEITEVYARHIETSKEVAFSAPLFADCTGDGTIGFLAGADYAMGREGRDEFGEPTAPTTWTIDLHYPDPKNTKHCPGREFKSIAVHKAIHPYPIPYRCFYSRNVDNLFMAGRNISVTHVALGTVRVMRTTGMMGEVVGMAASVAAS